MTLRKGTRLGSYEVLDAIGAGAMGEVYRATDTKLRRDVAIKVLPEEVAQDAERLARFQREALLLAALNHPNIATIHGLEESEGRPCLVMELVEGETLGERLAGGALPADEVIRLGQQIAAALEAAHEKGIIHRDLKPDNIKMTADGTVKVLDFGLAKAFDVDPAEESGGTRSPTVTSGGTRAGVILGTAAYMSPEQARGKPLDKRTDVWSLGCVLYECLAGRRPFGGETVTDVLSRILQVEPDWSALPESTPPRVRDLLQRCLEKDARNRLRDAGDARLELARAAGGQEWTTSGIAASLERPTARLPWASRRAALILLAGLVLGAGLGAGLLGVRSSRPSVPARVSIVTAADVIGSPSVSPDGRTVGFIAATPDEDGGATTRLYLRRLDSYGEEALRGSERASDFVFSPDGAAVAFIARDPGDATRRRLFRAPVDGSSLPVALADVPMGLAGLGVWLEQGVILGVKSAPWSLERFPSEGGQPEASVTIQADSVGYNFLRVTSTLPGDDHVLVAADSYGERGWQMNVVLLDVVTGEASLLLPGDSPRWSPTGHIVFTRGDKLLAVGFDPKTRTMRGGAVTIAGDVRVDPGWVDGRVSLGGGTLAYLAGGMVASSRRLALVDRSGHVEPWSEERRFFFGSAIVSADGRRVAAPVVNLSEGLIEIWISEFDRPRLRPFVDEPGMDCSLGAWSPAADRIAYRCAGSRGTSGVYVKDVDSGEERLLLEMRSRDENLIPTDFTPDGSAVLVARAQGENVEMIRVPVADGVEPASGPETYLEESAEARFSPDGRLVAYTSFRSGRPEIIVRPVGTDGRFGRERPVSVGVGGSPVWGRAPKDGEYLLTWASGGSFSPTEGTAIRALREATVRTRPTLEASEPRILLDSEEVDRLGVFAWDTLPDGRLLIIQRTREETEARQIHVVLDFARDLTTRLPPS